MTVFFKKDMRQVRQTRRENPPYNQFDACYTFLDVPYCQYKVYRGYTVQYIDLIDNFLCNGT